MSEDHESKSEEPTPKRLEEAHEEGQFAQSSEVAVVAVLMACMGVFGLMGPQLAHEGANSLVYYLSHLSSWEITPDRIQLGAAQVGTFMLLVASPVLTACVLAAIAAGGIQSGFRLTPKVISFKWERLNPAHGFSQIFGKGAWVRCGMDLLKLAAIGILLYGSIEGLLRDPIFHFMMPVSYLAQFMWSTAMGFLKGLVVVLSVIAALSYFFQWKRMKESLKMSPQEIKEELKSMETSAQVKSARRRLARQLLRRQMYKDSALADVVVTNPTHYAVALKYERDRDSAPIVLAKGENLIAKRILEITEHHGVPRVENPPTARLLYKIGRVGQPIPTQLYKTVAEILAQVYKAHRYYFHRLKVRRQEYRRLEGEIKKYIDLDDI